MRTLYTAEDIADRIDAMAADIADACAAQTPAGERVDLVLVAILLGGLPFAADLGRALYRQGVDAHLDCLRLSSYGDERTSSGTVRLVNDIKIDVEGRAVLLADDVLDTGLSLAFARAHLEKKGAASVRAAVLADKQLGDVATKADYTGFACAPDAFLIGSGMDDAGAMRFAPFIAVAEG